MVYIGSFKLTNTLAQQLSRDLKGLLSRPVNNTEIEFAPGVVGRFMGFQGGPSEMKFHQYGGTGITYLWKDMDILFRNNQTDLMVKNAFRELVRRYGNYFVDKTWLAKFGDKAMSENGGIDLNKADQALQVQSQPGEEGITFHIDPAMLAQYTNAPGFTPEVVSIKPLESLKAFLVGAP
jgi:hypothetical protein